MPEYRTVGQEVWIREARQCSSPPRTYVILRGSDGRFYPSLCPWDFDDPSYKSVFLDGSLVSFASHAEAQAFLARIAVFTPRLSFAYAQAA